VLILTGRNFSWWMFNFDW